MRSDSCNMLSTTTSSEQGEVTIMQDNGAYFKTCVLFVNQPCLTKTRTFSCELTQKCMFFEKSNLSHTSYQESYIQVIREESGERLMSCHQEISSDACGEDFNNSSVTSSLCDNLAFKMTLFNNGCHQSSFCGSNNLVASRAVFHQILVLSMESDLAGSVTQEFTRSPAFVDSFMHYAASKGMRCRKLACRICGSSFISESSLSSRCCFVIFMKFPSRIPINYSW